MPELTSISKAHIHGYLARIHATCKPATANMRFRGLHRFFGWLQDEQEVKLSPMTGMKPPRFDLEPPGVLTEDQVRAMLQVCSSMDFEDRRDQALIRFLYDTGSRRGEIEEMETADVDLRQGMVRITGKTGTRTVAFGKKTATALDRYIRTRARHPSAVEPWLWLGKKGRLTGNGIIKWLSAGQRRPAASASTASTCSGTPSPTPGWRPAGRRAT